MLVSAVIRVRPEREGQVPGGLGKALQSLFYGWLGQHNTELARKLHDANEVKPFSVSNLAGTGRGAVRFQGKLLKEPLNEEETSEEISPAKTSRAPYRPGRTDLVTVNPEQEYWFRLTTYHPVLSKLLQEKILPGLPSTLQLLDVPFEVLGSTTSGEEHPWAGTDSFEAISMRQMLNPAPASRFTFRFSSPTTFTSGGRKLIFPLPELVFGSLLNRWNENAPLALDKDLRRYTNECLSSTYYKLATRVVSFEEFFEPGFVGVCEFTALNRDRYWLGLLASLAEFTFYSGVGHRVTMGLGQARWLPPRPRHQDHD